MTSLLLVFACSSGEPATAPDASAGDDAAPAIDGGVVTLAGQAVAGDVDGDRLAARFANPVNVALGPDGLVHVADFDNGKIRVIDPEDGTTQTLVAQPGFSRPFGMAFAADGTLYVTTDRSPNNAQGPMSGTVWRVRDGIATAIAIGVGRPRGIVAMPDGRLAISDYQHHVIRLVDPTTGAITSLAGTWDAPGFADGNGASARFANPYGIALLDGKLVVADKGNHRIRLVALDGTVETLVGTGVAGYADGGAEAMLHDPQAVSVAAGEVFVADLGNFRVRRIRAGTVDTVAGNGTGGHLDSGDLLSAQLFGLEGITATADGSRLFVADGSRGEDVPYHRVRTINR